MSDLKQKTEFIKQWGMLLATILSLVTAVSAHMKGEKEEIAKAGYTEMSAVTIKLAENQAKIREDVANLRGFMEGQQHFQKKRAENQKEENIKIGIVGYGGGRKTAAAPPPPTQEQKIDSVIAEASKPLPKMQSKSIELSPTPLEDLVK